MIAKLDEEKVKQIVKKGTTTVGMVCEDGVVLAADKRVSYGYLNIHELTKVYPITSSIALTVAGGVGDNQVLVRHLKAQMELWEMRKKAKPTTRVCATLLANILFGGKGYFPFYVQMLVAGYGKSGKGILFSLGADGSIIEDSYASTGSGSVVAYGVLDQGYKSDIKVEEGIKLAAKAISGAIKRDVFTGNGIDVFVIDNSGVKKLSESEIEKNLQ